MADTIRTQAAILALLADNVAGDISAQDIRDLVVSLAVYGDISLNGGVTAQTGIGTAFTGLMGFNTDGPAAGTTPDQANNNITVDANGDGIYACFFQISFSGSPNTQFTFELQKDGVTSNHLTIRTMGGGGDSGSASFLALLSGVAAAEVFTIAVKADGASKSITPNNMQLVVLRVA